MTMQAAGEGSSHVSAQPTAEVCECLRTCMPARVRTRTHACVCARCVALGQASSSTPTSATEAEKDVCAYSFALVRPCLPACVRARVYWHYAPSRFCTCACNEISPQVPAVPPGAVPSGATLRFRCETKRAKRALGRTCVFFPIGESLNRRIEPLRGSRNGF